MSHRKAFTLIALLVAILLPSLAAARYQAKVIKCKATLRGIARAQLTYTTDNNGYYPLQSPRQETNESNYNLTYWRRGWTLREKVSAGPAQHDIELRPIYRDYMGGTVDQTMKCPLAPPYFQENNLDDLNVSFNNGSAALSSYMMYTTNNWRQSYLQFADVGANEKVDTYWSTRNSPEFEFTMLASDYVWRANPGFLQSGHPGPNASYGQVGNQQNYTVVWNMGGDLSAPVNFADGDGSVQTFNVDGPTVFDTSQWVYGWSYGLKAVVPTALAK